jgi:hypothetical protein
MWSRMTISKYTVAPPSVAPLLHQYDDWDAIPEEAWREYIAAHAYWARSWLMYADPPVRKRKQPVARPDTPAKSDKQEASAEGAATPGRTLEIHIEANTDYLVARCASGS